MSLVYLFITFFFFVVFMFLFFIFTYSFFLFSYSKSSPFECGFQPFVEVGFVFSMPFFIVSLLFLLFDVEIILLCFFPFSSIFYFSYFIYWSVLSLVFFITLYEWMKGAFSWV